MESKKSTPIVSEVKSLFRQREKTAGNNILIDVCRDVLGQIRIATPKYQNTHLPYILLVSAVCCTFLINNPSQLLIRVTGIICVVICQISVILFLVLILVTVYFKYREHTYNLLINLSFKKPIHLRSMAYIHLYLDFNYYLACPILVGFCLSLPLVPNLQTNEAMFPSLFPNAVMGIIYSTIPCAIVSLLSVIGKLFYLPDELSLQGLSSKPLLMLSSRPLTTLFWPSQLLVGMILNTQVYFNKEVTGLSPLSTYLLYSFLFSVIPLLGLIANRGDIVYMSRHTQKMLDCLYSAMVCTNLYSLSSLTVSEDSQAVQNFILVMYLLVLGYLCKLAIADKVGLALASKVPNLPLAYWLIRCQLQGDIYSLLLFYGYMQRHIKENRASWEAFLEASGQHIDSKESGNKLASSQIAIVQQEELTSTREVSKPPSESTFNQSSTTRVLFILYILHKLQMHTHSRDADILLLTLYMQSTLNFSILRVSSILYLLRCLPLSSRHAFALHCLEDLISEKVHSLDSGDGDADKPTSKLAPNDAAKKAAVSLAAGKENPGIDLEDLWPVKRSLSSKQSVYIRTGLDISSVDNTARLNERMGEFMRDGIRGARAIFEGLGGMRVHYREMLTRLQQVVTVAKKCETVFQASEELGQKSLLFPYALFVEQIHNDKARAKKLIKINAHRIQLSILSRMKERRDQSIMHSLGSLTGVQEMVALEVQTEEENIGKIHSVSKNCRDVLGVHWHDVQGRNVNDLLVPEFATMHFGLMKRFLTQMSVPYFNQPRNRLFSVKKNEYLRGSVVVRVSPRINSGFRLICGMKHPDHQDDFMLVNRWGQIIGGSPNAFKVLPELRINLNANLSAVSKRLERLRNCLMFIELYQHNQSARCQSIVDYLSKYKYSREEYTQIREWVVEVCKEEYIIELKCSVRDGDSVKKKGKVEFHFGGEKYTDEKDCYFVHTVEFEVINRLKVREAGEEESENDDKDDEGTESDSGSDFKGYHAEVMKMSDNQKSTRNLPSKSSRRVNMPQGGSIIGNSKRYIDETRKKISSRRMSMMENMMSKKELSVSVIMGKLNLHQSITDGDSNVMDARSAGSSVAHITQKGIINELDVTTRLRWYGLFDIIVLILLYMLFWATSIFMQSEAEKSIDTAIKDIMDTRHCMLHFLYSDQYRRNAIVNIYRYELAKRGLKNLTEYSKQISKDFELNPSKEAYVNYLESAKEFSGLGVCLSKRSYTDWLKFLGYRVKLTIQADESRKDLTFTKSYNLFEVQRLFMGYFTKMYTTSMLNPLPTNVMKTTAFRELEYQSMDEIQVSLIVKTAVNLLVLDEAEYLRMVNRVDIALASRIGLTALSSVIILFIVLRLRSKIIQLLNSFEVMEEFEVAFKIGNLDYCSMVIENSIKENQETLETEGDTNANNKRTDGEPNLKLLEPQQRVLATVPASYENLSNIHAKNQGKSRVRRKGVLSIFSWFGILAFNFVLLFMMAVYVSYEYTKCRELSIKNKFELEVMGYNRKYNRVTYTSSNIMLKIYSLATQIAGLRSETLSTYSSMVSASKSIQAMLDNFELNLKSLTQFIFNTASIQNLSTGFEEMLKFPCAGSVDLGLYSMSLAECRKLSDGNAQKDYILMYNWLQLQVQNIMVDLNKMISTFNQTGQFNSSALDILTSNSFTQLEFLVEMFFMEFYKYFELTFYPKLYQFHDKISKVISIEFRIAIIITCIASLIILYLGIRIITRRIRTAIQGLNLIPMEVYKHNAFFKAKINSLARFR